MLVFFMPLVCYAFFSGKLNQLHYTSGRILPGDKISVNLLCAAAQVRMRFMVLF